MDIEVNKKVNLNSVLPLALKGLWTFGYVKDECYSKIVEYKQVLSFIRHNRSAFKNTTLTHVCVQDKTSLINTECLSINFVSVPRPHVIYFYACSYQFYYNGDSFTDLRIFIY